ncbi:sodium transport system permease protein [Rubritalea squalenifaciens DSM 18772]|uniref:Sodium transport system permease protein n=1 Tax=Rubritalea squalenifaciens DSM 18772 TaxID=1123071 RepID=A0A1M6PTJ6_9BACT|nr:sodium transport system permease protein [Rubritalea squalenifaciens DSM 18772]
MLDVLLATLKKEVREALRDKRTLFLTILMPLVFYPAMIALTGWMTVQQQASEKTRVITVGFSGITSLTPVDQTENVLWINVSKEADPSVLLSKEGYDVIANFLPEADDGRSTVKLHYLGTAAGEATLSRVRILIRDLEDHIVEQRLEKKGLDKSYIDPFELEVTDHATTRISAGSKFGGIGAYFLVFLAFTGCMAVAVDTAAGEKERGTLEAILATPARFLSVAGGKLIYVSCMGMLSVLATIGGIGLLIVLGSYVATGEVGGLTWPSVFAAMFLMVLVVLLFASLLYGSSILSRSTKEAHLKAALMMLVTAMVLIYCTLPGVPTEGTMMYVPVLNVALALRAIWEGLLTPTQYLGVAGMTLGLAVMILLSVSWLVRRNPEKALLK